MFHTANSYNLACGWCTTGDQIFGEILAQTGHTGNSTPPGVGGVHVVGLVPRDLSYLVSGLRSEALLHLLTR